MTERPRGALRQGALPLLLLVDLAARMGVLVRPLKYVDGLTLPDDAYLSLEIARNIAHGHGPWYGLAYTNGYQPLYVFLMVPFYWIWPTNPVPPVHAALALLTVFDLITLWILVRWILRLTDSPTAAWAAGLAWAFDPYVIGTTLNGLESVMAVCFAAGSLAAFDSLITRSAVERAIDTRAVHRLGGWLGLALFARLDALVLAAVLGVGLIVTWLRAGRTLPAVTIACLRVAAVALAVNGPRLLYSFHYTGEWMPHSGEAVRFISLSDVNHLPTLQNYYLPQMRLGLAAIGRGNGILAAGTLAAGLLSLFGHRPEGPARPSRTAVVGVLLAYAIALFCAYTLYVFGPWFYDRYLFPITLPLIVLFALLVDRAVRGLAARSARAGVLAGVAAVTFAAASGVGQTRFAELYTSTDTFWNGYMNLGLWARRKFPPGTRIGSSQTGALAYFAPELVVVNLDGVVNAACFTALKEFRDLDYIRSVGVQYVVNWEEGDQFLLKHSRGATEADLPVIEHLSEFASWRHPWLLFEVRK